MYKVAYCSWLLLMSIASVNVSANTVSLIGDVNGDGVVDFADAVGVINYFVGKTSSPFNIDVADVDGDGVVDVADAVLIINIAVGKDKKIPADTIKIEYQSDNAFCDGDYDKERIHFLVNGTNIKVTSTGKQPFVCLVEGNSPDGSLIVDADTTCTVILNNLQLTSLSSAAISFPQKQKVNIELPKGTQSVLCDATSRDKKDGSNACLYGKGTFAFTGKGTLSLSGNYSHGIASSKNISVDGSSIVIADVVKNGIHCDKFTLKKGQVDLHLQSDASKGIKSKEELVIKGGTIGGEATGGVTNDNGDLSYSSLLKSDGSMTVSGGTLTLKQFGDGGRCISVDKDLTMTGGTLNLECFGNGGQYTNKENEEDYYTPKCITVDDSVKIVSGTITCLSTGLGGKGIVAGKFLSIGNEHNDEQVELPIIRVKTTGRCIFDDIDEDKRFGCPKGIKAGDSMEIFNGKISVTTEGQGGEGLECKGSIKTYKASITCETFDDGINVGQNLSINGTYIYCHAINNDGIDSNGKITINSGVVISISEHEQDKSFDSERGRFYVYGGIILGIGNDWVKIRESEQPVYTTTIMESIDTPISLKRNRYLVIQDERGAIVSLYVPCEMENVFLTCSSPVFQNNYIYQLLEAENVQNADREEMEGKIKMGGEPIGYSMVKEIIPMIFNNQK